MEVPANESATERQGADPTGENQNEPFQVPFNVSLQLPFQRSRVTSDGGLILGNTCPLGRSRPRPPTGGAGSCLPSSGRWDGFFEAASAVRYAKLVRE